MVYVALVLSAASFVISIAALITLLAIQRRLRRSPSSPPWSDEALTRDAWLEEIEARGQAVIARIEEAQQRWSPPAPASTTSSPLASTMASTDYSSGESPPNIADRPGRDVTSPGESTTQPMEKASVRDEVRRLADEGYDVAAIARRLRLGRGEVELFLGLSDRSSAAK